MSAWLARRGARLIGVDPADAQLRTARLLQHEFDLHFPLVPAAGEQVPLPSSSFDLVISEYGAAIWADPYGWMPEAARLLRPGGELVFLGNAVLLMLCVPDKWQAVEKTPNPCRSLLPALAARIRQSQVLSSSLVKLCYCRPVPVSVVTLT